LENSKDFKESKKVIKKKKKIKLSRRRKEKEREKVHMPHQEKNEQILFAI